MLCDNRRKSLWDNGGRGIRTLEHVAVLPVFKTGAIGRSAIPPGEKRTHLSRQDRLRGVEVHRLPKGLRQRQGEIRGYNCRQGASYLYNAECRQLKDDVLVACFFRFPHLAFG